MYCNVHLQLPEAEENNPLPYLPVQALYILYNIEIPTNPASDNPLLKQIIYPIYLKQEYQPPINKIQNQVVLLKTTSLNENQAAPGIHHHQFYRANPHPNPKPPF